LGGGIEASAFSGFVGFAVGRSEIGADGAAGPGCGAASLSPISGTCSPAQ
jgi:hypothetical protein